MNGTAATVEEIQIVRMAKLFRGEILAQGATVLADLATRLAKLLYDDDLVLYGGSFGAWDCAVLPVVEDEEYLARGSAQGQFGWELAFDIIATDRFRIVTGPVQVDRWGSANISVIGDWDRPTVQLVGARGLPDDLWRVREMNFHMPKQTSQRLVEKVDFASSFGYGEVRNRLRESGKSFKEPMKPGILVTNLGVFRWPESSGEIELESLHPGVTPDEMRRHTGFDLDIPRDVPVTDLPTAQELEAIRHVIDPWNFRTGSDAAGRATSRALAMNATPLRPTNRTRR